MKVILNHKSRTKNAEVIINNLIMVKSYLESKKLQEYIDFDDIIYQLQESIKLSQNLYNELNFLYSKVGISK